MASRADFFARLEPALIDAGVRTVYRQIFIPSEAGLPPESYPVAAYYEDKPEDIDDYEYGSRCEPQPTLDIWINCGDLGPYDTSRNQSWAELDNLHDEIVKRVNVMFINYSAGTMVYSLTNFQPYWFMGNEPAVGGGFTVKQKYTIAPAASDIPA